MKITVLLPTYNRPELIQDAIYSFLDQQYYKKELIITDDGSSNKEVTKVCMKFVERYKEIRYFYQKNQGIGSSLNLGYQNATGDLCCLIADDDCLYGENSLEFRLDRFLENDFLDVLINPVIVVNEWQEYQSTWQIEKIDLQQEWKADYMNTLGFMWKRKTFEGFELFQKGLKCNEDWRLKLLLLSFGNVEIDNSFIVAKYRQHSLNKSSMNINTGCREKCEKLLKADLLKKYPKSFKQYENNIHRR